MSIGFRRLTEGDLRLLHDWLEREHVRRWWSKHETYEDVVDHYLPAIEGRDPTELYAILLEEAPAGLIQTYLVEDHPEYHELVQVEAGVAGVDLFLAEENLIGRGFGTEILERFVHEVVLSVQSTHACIADPDAQNIASLRAFEKAGFRRICEFVDPNDRRTHTLVRFDR